MSRGDDRRAAIVEALADHLLAHGLNGSSLRPLAKSAGLSDRMLLYYFPDKAAAIDAALEVVAARVTAALEAHRMTEKLPAVALERHLSALLADAAFSPALALWLDIVAASARGDAAMKRAGTSIAESFVAWVAAQASDADAAIDILATIEGRIVLRSVGIG